MTEWLSFFSHVDRETSRWMRAIEELCLSQTAQVVNSVDLLQSGPSQKEYTGMIRVHLTSQYFILVRSNGF